MSTSTRKPVPQHTHTASPPPLQATRSSPTTEKPRKRKPNESQNQQLQTRERVGQKNPERQKSSSGRRNNDPKTQQHTRGIYHCHAIFLDTFEAPGRKKLAGGADMLDILLSTSILLYCRHVPFGGGKATIERGNEKDLLVYRLHLWRLFCQQ